MTTALDPSKGPPGCSVGLSDHGGMTKELMLEWIKFFIANIPPARPFLIIWDGHDTHIFLELLLYVISQGGIALQVPSHSTHYTQGADQVFGQAVRPRTPCALRTQTKHTCRHVTDLITARALR
jgi:hypothetical protein